MMVAAFIMKGLELRLFCQCPEDSEEPLQHFKVLIRGGA